MFCIIPVPIYDACSMRISLCQHYEIAHAANKHSQNYLTDFEWQIEKFSPRKFQFRVYARFS